MTDNGTPTALEQVNGVIGTPDIGDSVIIHFEDHHDPYEAAVRATITGIDEDTLHVTVDVNGYADYNTVSGVTPGDDYTVTPGQGTNRFSQTVYTVAKFHAVQTDQQGRQKTTA